MKVTAWNNGNYHPSGAGYGLKVAVNDRDRYFDRSWQVVTVRIPDGSEAGVNVAKRSFWNDSCRELISKEIGQWMVRSGLAPWQKGHPPTFDLEPLANGCFELSG